ncbi:MAG: DUF2304 domain-containing protein [Eubacterium sp.]
MIIQLKIFLIVAVVVYLSIIVYLLKKKSLNLRYSLIWLFFGIIMLILSIFPNFLLKFASFIGIVNTVNIVFVAEGMFVLIILLSLTSIVSHLNDKNQKLVQTIGLLEERIRKLEKNKM